MSMSPTCCRRTSVGTGIPLSQEAWQAEWLTQIDALGQGMDGVVNFLSSRL